MPSPRHTLLISLWVALPFAPFAAAQDERSGGDPTGEAVSYREWKNLHTEVDLGEGRATLMGDVELRWGERRIRCDSLVAWFSEAEAEEDSPFEGFRVFSRRLREIYAEGTVIYSHPESELAIRCDRLYLDLRSDLGLVIDAEVSTKTSPRGVPVEVKVRASELRILGRNRLEAIDARFAASPFEDPDIEINSDRIIVLDEPSPLGRQRRLELRENRISFAGLPYIWLPDFAVDSSASNRVFFIQDVRLGQSSELGFSPGVTVGLATRAFDGAIELRPSVDLDYFSKRGFGIGPEVAYRADNFFGRIETRYQRDDGEDRRFGRPPTRDRGRASLYHRHRLFADTILDLEAHVFSDRGFFPTFEERLDKTLKPPETLAHLRKAWDRHRLSALFSHRLNDFETTTEARPELRYDLVTAKPFSIAGHPIYLNSTVRLGNLRRRFDAAENRPTRTTLRADMDHLAETSFPLGPLRARPFVGVRASWFEEDARGGGPRGRLGFTYGATLSSDLARDFDVQSDVFDLDGLHHRVLPEIVFSQTLAVDPESQDLIPFDEVEAFDNEQFLAFRVRNLLSTWRGAGADRYRETVIDLEIEQRLQFQSTPRDEGDLLAPLDVDLLWRLGPTLDLVSAFEYDWDGGFEVSAIAVGWTPDERTQAYTGYRGLEDGFDAWFLEGRHVIDEKWIAQGRIAFDFQDSRALDHELTLSRLGAEWVTEFRIGFDGGEENLFFSVSLLPLLFWDPDDQAPVLRSEPRLGWRRTRFYR